MQQKPGNAAQPRRQDEVTVRLPPGALPAAQDPPDGVTVLVPGAMLAPAPTPEVAHAGEAPVFVDDSGNRKRLLRLAGVLIALLSIGFIAIVGVALAVPNVATKVGLGNVMPFIVPGAAAIPFAQVTPTPRVQVAQPKPKPKPAVVAAPTTRPESVELTTTPAPTTTTTAAATATTQATATAAPATQATATPAPGGAQTGGTPGGQVPVDVNPPVADANTGAAAQN